MGPMAHRMSGRQSPESTGVLGTRLCVPGSALPSEVASHLLSRQNQPVFPVFIQG